MENTHHNKTQRNALKAVFGLSVVGMLFSGTLSYLELFCNTATSCPVVTPAGVPLLGYPACVYGFGMFVLLTTISGIGLFGRKP